jgi:cell division protein FtsZ
MLKFTKSTAQSITKIKIVGVGGAGNNAINTMINNELTGVEFIAVNTDLQALNSSLTDTKIQIGKNLVNGLGAGSNPGIGKLAAQENEEEMKRVFDNADMIFITAGMGGGTGTGAAPVLADIAKEKNILTVAIVTYPLLCEGKIKSKVADKGINELKSCVNTLIVIPNERVKEKYGELGLCDAFKKADGILYDAARSISDIVNKSGYINVDLADVRTVMSEMGYALMGIGKGKGENKAEQATQEAISNPLLSNLSLTNAKAILINITAGYDLKLSEFDKVVTMISEKANQKTNIIEGLVFEEDMKNKLDVTIIATGIPEADDYKLPIKHIIKEKSHDQEITEIQQILRRIHQAEKLSPYVRDKIASFHSDRVSSVRDNLSNGIGK